jgi:hypothetical protein
MEVVGRCRGWGWGVAREDMVTRGSPAVVEGGR